ncbi:MAG: TetR/AcrR family transcriptional regulator [Clostridiales bacterium]|nr:TetR/AcrR family transcriptional regulator [Clostridiales bacterium]
MDRRKQRTLHCIQSAFLQLRATKPLERVTVRELADLADISKATFYLYHKDIYDLSEQMQREVIHELYQRIPHPEEFFRDYVAFSKEMNQVCADPTLCKQITALFSGRQELLLNICTQESKACLLQVFPKAEGDLQFDVLVTYVVYGRNAQIPMLQEPEKDERWIIVNDMTQTLIQKYRPDCLA